MTLAIEEVFEPLARVAGGQPGGTRVFLGIEAVAPAHPDLVVQQPLDALHHARVVLGHHLSDFETGVDKPRGWDDLVQQTDTLCLFGGDNAPGVEEFLGLRQPYQPNGNDQVEFTLP